MRDLLYWGRAQMMKIFISHKQEDAYIAAAISKELERLDVSFYLDVLDNITENGKTLTDHIKNSLNSCTDIIVIISSNTYKSQWVPFEVGMAAQQDMPTVTYLEDNVCLPDFLGYWPRLTKMNDIKKYIDTKRKIDRYYEQRRYGGMFENADYQKMSKTERFYAELKEKL